MKKIERAALRLLDMSKRIDIVYPGYRHADIYEKLHKDRVDLTDFIVIEGFLTNDGKFVDRYEAKHIAVAANQLIVPEEDTYPALFSEDVW